MGQYHRVNQQNPEGFATVKMNGRENRTRRRFRLPLPVFAKRENTFLELSNPGTDRDRGGGN